MKMKFLTKGFYYFLGILFVLELALPQRYSVNFYWYVFASIVVVLLIANKLAEMWKNNYSSFSFEKSQEQRLTTALVLLAYSSIKFYDFFSLNRKYGSQISIDLVFFICVAIFAVLLLIQSRMKDNTSSSFNLKSEEE